MDEIEKLHSYELDILKNVDNVCNRLDINYFIMFGTLLGAIRHKGFIPWDDDMDICMLRSDYDKFIAEGNKYLPENIKIQHCLTESECPNIFAKVRNINTTFLAQEHINLNINHGIFIDVFPVDNISSNPFIYKTEALWRKLFQIINNCYDEAYINSIKRNSSLFIAKIIRCIIINGLLHNKTRKEFILSEDRRRANLKSDDKNFCFLSLYPNVIFSKSKLNNLVKYKFENEEIWGPADYDEILSKLYGDYMIIPPKEKQITHKPLEINFDHGYKTENHKK